MKFRLTATRPWEEEKYIEPIRRANIPVSQKPIAGQIDRDGNIKQCYHVEIESINDLKSISVASGNNPLIFWFSDDRDIPSIEIYDDYRE